MRKRGVIDSQWFIITCVILIGFGVGWLVGLSVSPVVSTVLASVTGSITAIIAALGGLSSRLAQDNEPEPQPRRYWHINPLPLAALVLGIIIGSIAGLWMRNNQMFGSDASAEIVKWTNLGIPKEQIMFRLLEASYPHLGVSTVGKQLIDAEIQQWTTLGIPKEMVVQRIFNRQYPESGSSNASTDKRAPQFGTFLFSLDANECERLLAEVATARTTNNSQDLISALRVSTDVGLQRLPDIVSDPSILQKIVEDVLCKGS